MLGMKPTPIMCSGCGLCRRLRWPSMAERSPSPTKRRAPGNSFRSPFPRTRWAGMCAWWGDQWESADGGEPGHAADGTEHVVELADSLLLRLQPQHRNQLAERQPVVEF